MSTSVTNPIRTRSTLMPTRLTQSPSHARARVLGATCRMPLPAPIPVPRRPLGRFLGAVAVIAALAAMAALPAPASSGHRFDDTADGRLVDVQVQVEGRGVVPLFTADARHDRRYFQALRGRNYSLVVRNNTPRRVGVLIAVDGLNVISGERGALSRHESMYVLDPYERAVIRGWRTSLHEVRRFVFVDEERSYAERTGQANGDMGWIRVLAFREQRRFWDDFGKIRGEERPRDWRGDDFDGRAHRDEEPASPAPETREMAPRGELQEDRAESHLDGARRDMASRQSNPGTGWGERRSDHVNRTHFTAERQPVDRITLRYEYASGLRALGIFPERHHRDRLWERERGQVGFAQPPGR